MLEGRKIKQITRIYLFVGLGNPGPKYQFDRHNVGYMVGEELRCRWGIPQLSNRFQGLFGDTSVAEAKKALLLPTTYMNLSGRAVLEAIRWFKLPVDNCLVIHDEVELPFGEIRIKEGGGLGGHNGLRSLEQSLGTRDFWRLRVGVGRPSRSSRPLADYVLESFDKPREDILLLLGQAADLAEEWLNTRSTCIST